MAPVVTFAVVYHVGSRNEAVGYTGATHLLEHLMFKGTPEYNREKGTAIAAVLEALGARFNATTWFDRTNYYETIPSDQLEVVVRLEASRMRGALLRDEDRAPEMTVVRNEFERGENSPFQVLYKHTFADGVPRASVPPPDDRLAQRHRGGLDRAAQGVLRHLLPPQQRDGDGDRRLRGGGGARDDRRATSARSRPRARPIPPVYTVEPPQEGERRFVVRRVGAGRLVRRSPGGPSRRAHPDTPAARACSATSSAAA